MTRSPIYVYVGFAVVNLVSVGLSLKTLEWATKPLLMPTLIAVILLAMPNPHGKARLMVFGLAAATIADAALLVPGTTAFLIGMSFFLLMQVCYIATFIRSGAVIRFRKSPWIPAIFAIVFMACMSSLWNDLGDLALPIAIYGLALTTMAATAVSLCVWVGIGGVLFLISDLLIGVQVTGISLVGGGLIIMSTYILGQGLIVTGWLKHVRSQPEMAVAPS